MSTYLVVGGRGGIGRAVVARLEADGAEVRILDRVDGHDACDPDDVTAVLDGCERLDGLVHLAGTTGAGSVEEHSLEDWRRVLDDNLTSAFVCVSGALPALRAARGAVVLSSSVNGRTGGNTLSGPAYAAAKAGIIGLTRHIARTYAAEGIRANALAPGPVATPMIDRLSEDELTGVLAQAPLGRITEPAELAGLVRFLLSADAASITGATIDVNGGAWMS